MTTKLLHEFHGIGEFVHREATVSKVEDHVYEVLFADRGEIIGRVEVPIAEDKAERIAEDWVLGYMFDKTPTCNEREGE